MCTFNTLRPGQNGCHVADDILKRIFLNENVFLNDNFNNHCSLESDKSSLFQIMAWRRIGDKPLSQLMTAYLTDAYMSHSASMS